MLPKPGEFRAWRNTVFQNVNAAAMRHDDTALLWVKQVDDPLVTDEMLARQSEKRYALLCKRLSAALQRIAHGELGRQITALCETAIANDRAARGREILRVICAYYKTNQTAEKVFLICDLLKVKMKDTRNGSLETFTKVMTGLTKTPD